MEVKVHKFGHPSSEADMLTEKLTSLFSKMDVLVDDKRTQEIIKSFQTQKFIPKVKYPGLRMDVVEGGIGVLAVMGNKANIGARCFSSLYYANHGTITEQIFVAHSPANAWWREYRKKSASDWKYGTGNRLSSFDLRKMIDELYPELMRIPVTILSLEHNDSKINYSRFCEINDRVPITFP